jgi:predicted N-acetyltransferase YhbS
VQVKVRPLTADDIEAARDVQTRAFDIYDAANGEPVTEPTPGGVERARDRIRHFLTHDPGGCWVATIGDDVVGTALALRREHLWGLSLLVVDPERQSHGIGRALLTASLTYAEGTSTDIILSSQDPRAMRSYAVAGFELFPQISATGVPGRSGQQAPLLPVRAGSVADVALADAIDRTVRGAVRGPDHEAMAKWSTMFVVDHSTSRGYSYVRRDGRLVTIAANDDEAAASLLWDYLGRDHGAGDSRTIGHLTGEQQWAVRIAVAARLTLKAGGPVFWRGRTPPQRYIPDGAYL